MTQTQHLLLRSLRRETTPRTPVWIMRQAGRYLPEYQKIREKYDFLKMIKTPKIACEVTLQPVETIGVDAAIIFSDILVVPEAMGMALQFAPGPVFPKPIRTKDHIDNLGEANPDTKLSYVLETISLTKKQLADRVPVIGFCGGPLTVAAFMIEGKSPQEGREFKKMLREEPAVLHRLLEKLAKSTVSYLRAQSKAGADVIQIFDSLADLVTSEDYKEFGLSYIKMIIDELKDSPVPKILFAKGQNGLIPELASSGADCLSLDWNVNLGEARKMVDNKVSLQGNLDPQSLHDSPESIRDNVSKVLKSFGKGTGHIFNLGHGISPDVPVENVKTMVNAVKELSKEYH